MYAIHRYDATSFVAIGDAWGHIGFISRREEFGSGDLKIEVPTSNGLIVLREHYDAENDTSTLTVISGPVKQARTRKSCYSYTRVAPGDPDSPFVFTVDIGRSSHCDTTIPAGYDFLVVQEDAGSYDVGPWPDEQPESASPIDVLTVEPFDADVMAFAEELGRRLNSAADITEGLAELISLGFRWETALDWQDRVMLSLKGRGAPLLPACFLTNRPTLLEAVRDALEWARENRTLGNADLTPGDLFIAPAHTTTEPAQ